MLSRRGFLKSLGIGAAAVVAAPILKFAPEPIRIPVRKMMARIRITSEALEDSGSGAFIKAAHEEFAAVARDLMRRDERKMVRFMRRIPKTRAYNREFDWWE